uniref:Uncharacterized protein n=1 Tax=Salmo trutta TaxID=8032 RepID=A0A673X0D7_SALTR
MTTYISVNRQNSGEINSFTSGKHRNFCYECGDALPLPQLEDAAFCSERAEWKRKDKKALKRVRKEEFKIEDNCDIKGDGVSKKTVQSKKYATPTSGREMEVNEDDFNGGRRCGEELGVRALY